MVYASVSYGTPLGEMGADCVRLEHHASGAQKKGAHMVHHYHMRHDTGRKIRVTVYSAFPTEDYSHTGGEGQQKKSSQHIRGLYTGGAMCFFVCCGRDKEAGDMDRGT